MANISRKLDAKICDCPIDCNSIIFTQEISAEQLYPLYSQTFSLLRNTNNYLWKLEEELNNVTDLYQEKKLKDRYKDIIESSSVVHFYYKEGGIIKYTQEEVFGTMDLVGKYLLAIYSSYK